MTKPFATVLGPSTSLSNKTGSWRTVRPSYVDRLPPCNATCPAGENIQLWLSLGKEGKFREAWEVMVRDNPFPAMMGRACYHNCEKVCNREQFDGAVNINLIERSIGDIAIANGWKFENASPASGKKVLIIGAGPSGLSAAYFLRMLGHDVTVYEALSKAGGMARYGVPRFRLPAAIIDAEIRRIEELGVKIVCNKRISDISAEIGAFDATYVSIGAHVASNSNVEIKGSANVFNAIDLLRKLEDDPANPPNLGKRVFVYGGGNTAIDAARTALRFGVKSVKILYRGAFHNMSAHETEISEALAEGVEILCLRSISSVDSDNVRVEIVNYNEESDSLSKSGEYEILRADSVIFAVGQSADLSLLSGAEKINVSEKGYIEIDKNMMTGAAGVFAGGDVILGKRSITHAIGHGKKAARCMDAYLRGVEISSKIKHETANFKKLNTEYYKKSPRVEVVRFGEVSFYEKDVSYSDNEIVVESKRCFSCGNCFHCDNCYGYCPDNAIIKHWDGSLEINYDYCKGCGICAAECPCGSIKMVADE